MIGAAPHPHSRDYADFLASRPRDGRGRRDRRGHRGVPRAPVRGRTSCTSARRAPSAASRGAKRRRGAAHRRDLPALPHAHRRGGARRRHRVQVLPADPRGREPRRAVAAASSRGVIDFVVSDHSPAPAELKLAGDGDFAEAWGGIASLQLGLPLVWTEARRRGIPLARVVEWMSAAPARRVGLAREGRDRRGPRGRPRGVRPRRAVHGGCRGARAPASDHALRRPRARRGRARARTSRASPVDRAAPRGRLLRRAESEGGARR